MNINIKGKDFIFDLKEKKDQYKLLNMLILSKIKEMPILMNGLLYISDIEDVEEKMRDQIAYTYPDYLNNRIKICINFEKIENLNMDSESIIFLLLHEYLHNFFYHFDVMKNQFKENSQLSNISCDYFINEMLKESLKGNILETMKNKYNLEVISHNSLSNNVKKPLYFNNYHEAISERKLYEFLKENNEFPQLQLHAQHDKMFEVGNENLKKINEKRKENGLSEINEEEVKKLFETELNTKIEEIEKSYSPEKDGEIVRYLNEKIKKNNLLNTLKFKRIINNKLIPEYIKNYSKPNRKRRSDNFIFKGKQRKPGEKIVIAIDVSGSISEKELVTFYEIMNGYLKKDDSKIIDVIYWSSCEITEKNFHSNITDIKDILKLKPYSSGGTEIKYLDDFIEEYYKYPITLLNLTDGYFKYRKIPKHVAEYFFILTQEEEKKEMEKYYSKDKRVKIINIRG